MILGGRVSELRQLRTDVVACEAFKLSFGTTMFPTLLRHYWQPVADTATTILAPLHAANVRGHAPSSRCFSRL